MAKDKVSKGEKNIGTVNSKDVFAKLLKDTEEDHFVFVQPTLRKISTGSLLLDSLTKVYSGNLITLRARGAELGKTSQAFVFASNYMKEMPKSKTIYIKCEARLSPEMQSRSRHNFVFSAEDWNYGDTFVFPCNIFETIAKTLETLLAAMHAQGEHLCIIFDSLDHAILRQDYGQNKDVWSGKDSPKVAGVPVLFKLMMKRFALPLESYSGLLIVITQYTAEIKLDPYSREPKRQGAGGGGNNLNHVSSLTLTYQPRVQADLILENPNEKPDSIKNKTLGVYASVEITKASGGEVTGTKIKIPIKRGRIGSQIWVEKEIVDCCLAYEILSRSGAWYKFAPEFVNQAKVEGIELVESHQGMNTVYEYVESNPEVFKWLYVKFTEIIS